MDKGARVDHFDFLPDELIVFLFSTLLGPIDEYSSSYVSLLTCLLLVSKRFHSIASLDPFCIPVHESFRRKLLLSWESDLLECLSSGNAEVIPLVEDHYVPLHSSSLVLQPHAPLLINEPLEGEETSLLLKSEEMEGDEITIAQDEILLQGDSRSCCMQCWDVESQVTLRFPSPKRFSPLPPSTPLRQQTTHAMEFVFHFHTASLRRSEILSQYLKVYQSRFSRPSPSVFTYSLSNKALYFPLIASLWFVLSWGLRLDHVWLTGNFWMNDLICFGPVLLIPVWLGYNFLIVYLFRDTSKQYVRASDRLLTCIQFSHLYTAYADLLSPSVLSDHLSIYRTNAAYPEPGFGYFPINATILTNYSLISWFSRLKMRRWSKWKNIFIRVMREEGEASPIHCCIKVRSSMMPVYSFISMCSCFSLAIVISFLEVTLPIQHDDSEFSLWKASPGLLWSLWCCSFSFWILSSKLSRSPKTGTLVYYGISFSAMFYGVGLLLVGLKKGGEPFDSDLSWITVFSTSLVPVLFSPVLMVPLYLADMSDITIQDFTKWKRFRISFLAWGSIEVPLILIAGWLMLYGMFLEGVSGTHWLSFSILFVFLELLILSGATFLGFVITHQ